VFGVQSDFWELNLPKLNEEGKYNNKTRASELDRREGGRVVWAPTSWAPDSLMGGKSHANGISL